MSEQKKTQVAFADVVHQLIGFDPSIPSQKIALDLIDSGWIQRLRDISQTANTRLVYMFSEHSRFGHSLGVSYLANLLMSKLSTDFGDEIEDYRTAVSAAALLHDVGHLAPGSHTAFKTWFPTIEDSHEELAVRVVRDSTEVRSILDKHDPKLADTITKILQESPDVPPWTWEIISGGGWNVDRGNWCIVDSILAGVSYGRYNIPALIESMVITSDKHLALRENRLDAMVHFALSRHAMYRQIYQHRVLLSADTLNTAIAKRARAISSELPFADDAMKEVLNASNPSQLSLDTIYAMRESWWRYHVARWSCAKDSTLSDLCDRLLRRRLFKTVRVSEIDSKDQLLERAKKAVKDAGFDSDYYLHEITTLNVNVNDFKKSMPVLMEDGRIRHLSDAEPLFAALAKDSGVLNRTWLVMPKEAKEKLGRIR